VAVRRGGKGAAVGWFVDRHHAGDVLAAELAGRRADVVLALPRGGVPVAAPVARALGAALDVLVVRKLGVPNQPELAMGAIASGAAVVDEELAARCGVSADEVEAVRARERAELERRERAYRADRPPVDVRGRRVVVVDDGLATGASMRVALLALRTLAPAHVLVAVPVGAPAACASLRELADEVVCVESPEHFAAVGQWYEDFAQTTDDEVRALLADAVAT
jgi:putative phosphoribosyl transferase